MSNDADFIIEREFQSSPALLWKAWTTPALFARWYGPGAKTILHEFGLTSGDIWLIEMQWGEQSHFQKMTVKDIEQNTYLAWDHSSSCDAMGQPVVNPQMPDWPPLMLTELELKAQNDSCTLSLSQTLINATPAQARCFAQAKGGMSKGWNSGFAAIDAILTELKAAGR